MSMHSGALAALSSASPWPWLLLTAFLAAGLGEGCGESSSVRNGGGGIDGRDASPDSGSGGEQTDVASASACQPDDARTYRPDAYHRATAAGQGACWTPALIDGFYESCLSPGATSDACNAYRSDAAGQTCAKCILSPEGDARYGPLIDQGGFISANVAGCIELTDPGGLSCARALQALTGCEIAACRANCPVHDFAARMSYDACAAAADASGCHSYADATACVALELDAGPIQRCITASFKEFYDAVTPLFCGVPPARPDPGPSVLDAAGAGADASGSAEVGAADAGNAARSDGALSDAPLGASGDGPFPEAGAQAEASTDAHAEASRD